ncbi:hypothetical protein HanRHA438_Chr02g0048191 [Helianthus annuus]|nr:hypothetical protein HanRHA438_Chr02g0048191 [Helianthus annuus]
MKILMHAHIGLDETLVTLKDARLVNFCYVSLLLRHCNSFNSIKRNLFNPWL